MSRLRILLLGASGGLGRALGSHLSPLHDVHTLSRKDLDLEQPDRIASQLSRHEFDVLLNPAGMTSPDLCEALPRQAELANVDGPLALAEVCQVRRARLIHFSTDYVFSGQPHAPWVEEDETHPINTYGRTKRAGELAVLKACPHALIARVSWLFGPDKPSHPDHIIQRALQSDDLSAVEDKVSAPTSTADVCAWIASLLAHHPHVSGVLHLCNSGVASWHSWAEAALACAHTMGLPLKTTHVKPVRLATLTQLKAPRPLMTLMSNQRLQNLLGTEVRHWNYALEDYVKAQYQPKMK